MDNLSSELSKLKIDKSKRGDSRRRGSKAGWVVAILFILLAGGIGGYAYLLRDSRGVVVETVRPRLESPSESAVLVATGYVIAHHKIQVGSKIAGRVAWIGVEKGDRVTENQVVVRLEDREYKAQHEQAKASYDAARSRLMELERGSRPEEIERARSEVERAEAQLRTDEATFKRVQNLVREGVAPAQNLDEARGRFETSRAALDSARRTLELTQKGPRSEQVDNARHEVSRAQAAVDYAKTILDATEIHVPMSGTILERNVEQGEMVTTSFVGDRGAKSFVVTLADLNDIQVELDISQNDFNRVSLGQPCVVVTDAYPDRMYDCRVDEIAPEANRQKATVQVKVKFLKPDLYVKPEMNARVTFRSKEAVKKTEKSDEKFYVLPKSVVVDRDGSRAVFVVADGVVAVKPVTVAKEVGAEAYISNGLIGGESVISGEALAQVKAGDKVQTGK